jgi:hypothetical protein
MSSLRHRSIASMIFAISIRLQLRIGDDIVSIRLGKPVAVVSTSSRRSPLAVTAPE